MFYLNFIISYQYWHIQQSIENWTDFTELKFLIIFRFSLQSFFGRACKNPHLIPACKKNNRCEINKNTRTACKACRLTKCIQVGMSKEGSKFGRRSNWFKIKFLLEERQRKSIEQSPRDGPAMDELDATTTVPLIFGKFVESQMHQQQQSTSPTSLNGNDLPTFANVPPQHISPSLSNAFPSATMQYPFHSPFLYSTIEKLTAFYLNHHILKQHSLQHQQHQLPTQSLPQRFNNFDVHSYSSNVNTDYSVELSDKQDNPIDLSVKPKFPIDFTISGLMKVRSS